MMEWELINMNDNYKNLYCRNCNNQFEWSSTIQALKSIQDIFFKDNSKGTLCETNGMKILSIDCFKCGMKTEFKANEK